MDLEEVYNKVKSLNHDELIGLATSSAAEFLKYLKESGNDDEKSFKFLVYVTALFVGADGLLDESEYHLFCEITKQDISYEELNNAFKGGYNDEYINAMDQLIDRLPIKIKYAVCNYGLAFMGSDGEFTKKEKEVFEKILR